MAWTEEIKKQAHWKCGDIIDRTVTRADMSGTRAAIALLIHRCATAEVMRVDMENYYGNKVTIIWTEETKP